MWNLRESSDFSKGLKKFLKRHRRETVNALANLDSYLVSLRAGLKPQQIIRGWVHGETMGIVAIDETGPKNPRKAIRLYIYPDEDSEQLNVLLIGDKNRQQDDIKICEESVKQIQKGKASHGQANQQSAG